MRQTIKCNNCDSTNYQILYEESIAQIHKIVKCKDCGLMYAIPLEIDQLEIVGEGEVSAKTLKTAFASNFSSIVDQKEKIQIRDYLSSIKYVEKINPMKGTALEIGSSHGYFLHELEKRGWDVTGIEPSKNRREIANRLFGYQLVPDKLEDSNLPENFFNAIFLFHVIEHVLDPSDFISILYKYLKPGGLLVVETPTYDTLTYKILRHRERSIKSNGHLFFFTKNNLRKIMEKKGFTTLKHIRVGRTLTLERLFWNISKIINNEKIDKYLLKICLILKLNRVKIHLNMGDMQRIYCKK